MKKKHKNLLNKISGWIVIYFGISLMYNMLSGLSESFLTLIFGIGLIFLGVYVLRDERWAIILSGVYAIALTINMWIISKIIGGGWIIFLSNIPAYILIINWWVSESK